MAVKKRAGPNSTPPTSGSGGHKSEEELVKDRQGRESYLTAEMYLSALSWGNWVMALLWFLLFSEAKASPEKELDFVPSMTWRFSSCLGDANLVLLVSGVLCSKLCVKSDKKKNAKPLWSWWRKPWHLGWGICFGVLAFCFTRVGFATVEGIGKEIQVLRNAAASGNWIAIMCGLGAAGVVMTTPSGENEGPDDVSSPIGKLFMLSTGVLSLWTCWDVFLSTLWSAPMGPLTSAIAVCPLVMQGLACLFAGSEIELLAGVYASMVWYSGAAIKAFIVMGDSMVGTALLVPFIALCLLFLPIALDNGGNIYNTALMKNIDGFMKMLDKPASGFGDSGGD